MFLLLNLIKEFSFYFAYMLFQFVDFSVATLHVRPSLVLRCVAPPKSQNPEIAVPPVNPASREWNESTDRPGGWREMPVPPAPVRCG